MGNIRILPDAVANRIAAGEIVLRPASVVKELIDNSLDAGARFVEVVVERGGRSLIEVRDDGCGMDEDDALLAFERHATSKIARPEDLNRIHTLGFRGEALASIAAVARVVLETRTETSEGGTRIEIEGGRLKHVQTVGVPIGTRVQVRGLFFNVPARRKFLRSAQTELRHIVTVFQDFALAYHEVTFRLLHHRRELYYYAAVEKPVERIAQVLGSQCAEALIELEGGTGGYRLHGWISPPDEGSRTPETVHVFVNRRPVRDRWVSYIFRDAWQRYGARWPYPHLVAFLEVPYEQVDVNVHPTKLEVRFREPAHVQSLVRSVVEGAFEARRPVPTFDLGEGAASVGSAPWINEPVRLQAQSHPSVRPPVPSSETVRPPHEVAESDQPHPRALGQIHHCYLVVVDEAGLVVLDQHLVHERYLYETWGHLLQQGALKAQTMLVPVVLEVGPGRVERLQETESIWKAWGWVIHPFGPGAVAVQATPPGVWPDRVEETVQLLFEALEHPPRDLKEWEHDVLKEMACKAAIKKGARLSEEQIRFLVDTWYRLEVPQVCPHGRTMAVRLGINDLHRAFGRTWNLQEG